MEYSESAIQYHTATIQLEFKLITHISYTLELVTFIHDYEAKSEIIITIFN